MNKYQHLFLYTAIVSALYNTAWAADCDPASDICNTMIIGESGATINKNIVVSAPDTPAMLVEKGTTVTSNVYINGVNIISDQGTAIQVDGSFTPGRIFSVKGGATVQGGNGIAMDFRQASGPMRADIVEGSTIIGDILGNGNTEKGNKINFALNNSTAIFNGNNISGFNTVENWGTLTIIGQDSTIHFGGTFVNQKDSNLVFQLNDRTNLDEAILRVDKLSLHKEGSTVSMGYNGSHISNIINKDIVLIEATEGITNADKVTITGTDGAKLDISPLLTQTNSWIEASPPQMNGGVSGNQLIVNYGVSYGGASIFAALAEQGGASSNALRTTAFIVPNVLSEFNGTHSAASDQALALLVSAGSNAEAIATLANQMTPNSDGSEIRAANQLVGDMRNNIAQRQLGYLGQLPLQERDSGWNLWVNTLYGHGTQSGNDYATGFRINRYGISLGADQEIDDSAMLGFALGYSHSQADSRGVTQSKRIDAVELMPYLGWRSGILFADGNLNIGYLRVNSERQIGGDSGWQGETRANGDYTGMQAGYQLNAGLNLELGALHLRPMLTYQYQWLNFDSWRESGSILSLSNSSQKYSLNHLGGGLSAWAQYATGWGTLTPSMRVSYLHDLDGDRRILQQHALVSITNGGSTFETVGARVGGNQLRVDASARMDISESLNLGIGVGYNRDDRYGEGVIGLTLGNRF
ncbi:autotransporter domain-containing protein [Edwardsiella ictaluri]|uniref:Outer membrane autotransporter barrel domain protein n=2 Tax=Edwardsiella ictaluri TaxID=67780 RepID=C5B904_EDWI9|nr:autotransporter outer membrane beta-barrel domain-containing protein [Edwardsiella ictaluri]ACR70432.1 outer membrane autotransporter barrel domain protein [Edwardsiella ictaluri 93-146]ARD39340.1 autotransporter domain-containing protein [Edwardsiella ictaluri]AVZ82723.1 autotransporter domain-containing protein [Edwardsiella ictaluri]EKS7763976.1 autotransporter domain-containing protein [Edwardsiella ictaluri]EKS7770756.1 autotransporter domain-containing protein [Edwardsiella ictaluri]